MRLNNEPYDAYSGQRLDAGRLCLHCEEPLEGPCFELNGGRDYMHRECMIRGVSGSVGHQMGECSCFGKVDTSEDGLTKREAARKAALLIAKRLVH